MEPSAENSNGTRTAGAAAAPSSGGEAVRTDSHGQIIGRGDAAHADPPETDVYTGAADWPDPMPAEPLSAHAFDGMSPAEQLRTRGFAHFRRCFTPEFIEELRMFVDEGETGVAKYYPEGTSDFSKPSGEGNVFQGDQLSMSFREEAKAAPAMACGSALARLVAWPRSIDALRSCGVERPKLWAGYILSKGAGGPPLYWHQECVYCRSARLCVPSCPVVLVLVLVLVLTTLSSSSSSSSSLQLAILERREGDEVRDSAPALWHDLPLQDARP
jgi:hypothetical protein